jgi:hypothetical protein
MNFDVSEINNNQVVDYIVIAVPIGTIALENRGETVTV